MTQRIPVVENILGANDRLSDKDYAWSTRVVDMLAGEMLPRIC